jgi:hypothetical protein
MVYNEADNHILHATSSAAGNSSILSINLNIPINHHLLVKSIAEMPIKELYDKIIT